MFLKGKKKNDWEREKKSILFVLVSRGGFFRHIEFFQTIRKGKKGDRFFFTFSVVNFFGLCEWL